LLGAGDPTYAAPTDFNGTERLAGIDAGAYAWTGAQNPGWQITAGFKEEAPGPTLSLEATPTTVDFQGQATLSWTAANAESCEASGAWSGTKDTTGEQETGPLETTSDFTLACDNAAGDSVSRTVTVSVDSAEDDDPPTLNLSVSSISVAMNGSATLTWSTTDAETCEASGTWSGNKATSGSESTGSLTADSTYSLTCTGAGGSVERSVTVAVQAADDGADDETGETSGGGAVSWLLLLLAMNLGAAATRSRQPVALVAAREGVDPVHRSKTAGI
jgi:hypothetical protein